MARLCEWWITGDPCGVICANMSVSLMVFGWFAINTVVLVPWYGWVSLPVVFYTGLTALNVYTHSKTQYSNPGAIPLTWTPPVDPPVVEAGVSSPTANESTQLVDGEQPAGAGRRPSLKKPQVCLRCHTIKPKHVHHCSTCNRCIINMDHHCPWVNNCVAMLNQKYFLLFLLYTASSSIFCGAFLIAKMMSCFGDAGNCQASETHLILGICNFLEALLFGLFTIVMMVDQLQAIFDNTSYIDSLKNLKGNSRSKMEGLETVFGEPFSYRWFLPVNPTPRLLSEFRRVGEDYLQGVDVETPHRSDGYEFEKDA